jgi:hypothetical protein
MLMQSKNLESKARRTAQRAGLVARKSRHVHPLENLGGFMLVDPIGNYAVAGFQYELEAEDVIDWCESIETV